MSKDIRMYSPYKLQQNVSGGFKAKISLAHKYK